MTDFNPPVTFACHTALCCVRSFAVDLGRSAASRVPSSQGKTSARRFPSHVASTGQAAGGATEYFSQDHPQAGRGRTHSSFRIATAVRYDARLVIDWLQRPRLPGWLEAGYELLRRRSRRLSRRRGRRLRANDLELHISAFAVVFRLADFHVTLFYLRLECAGE